jgi:hypothetical protein
MKKTALLILILIGVKAYCQTIPCRNWYYVMNKNGTSIKENCKEAWQENDNGDLHGKYELRKNSGLPLEISNYKNGVMHGKYNRYSYFGNAVVDSGRFVNGKKQGKWLHEGNCFVTYNNDMPVGTAVRKFKDLQLSGSYNQNGMYSGKVLLSGANHLTFAFPNESCNSCFKNIPDAVIQRFFDEQSDNENHQLLIEVENGSISSYEKMQELVDGKLIPNTFAKIKSIIADLKNESAEAKKQEELATQRRLKDLSGQSILDASSLGLRAISFQMDSYNADSQGEVNIEALVSYLKTLNPNSVKSFILIGHANADQELGKTTFDPSNFGLLSDRSGKETVMSERQLEELRFILSMGRAKTVFRAIEDLPVTQELISQKKFWMLPAGTLFGSELSQGNTNQNIVQLVILTNDDMEINTNVGTVKYGNEFKGPVLEKLNSRVRDLGYTFSKLVPLLLNGKTFAIMPPDFKELANDPNGLSAFVKQFI